VTTLGGPCHTQSPTQYASVFPPRRFRPCQCPALPAPHRSERRNLETQFRRKDFHHSGIAGLLLGPRSQFAELVRMMRLIDPHRDAGGANPFPFHRLLFSRSAIFDRFSFYVLRIMLSTGNTLAKSTPRQPTRNKNPSISQRLTEGSLFASGPHCQYVSRPRHAPILEFCSTASGHPLLADPPALPCRSAFAGGGPHVQKVCLGWLAESSQATSSPED
jgi:hypothetical protein